MGTPWLSAAGRRALDGGGLAERDLLEHLEALLERHVVVRGEIDEALGVRLLPQVVLDGRAGAGVDGHGVDDAELEARLLETMRPDALEAPAHLVLLVVREHV